MSGIEQSSDRKENHAQLLVKALARKPRPPGIARARRWAEGVV
ncbi:MAG TPA: hypothetical protein VND89_04430 [Acidimicrobiales bacterium]|nr:hypothetical protein [Acidimicrobiales bacterium]